MQSATILYLYHSNLGGLISQSAFWLSMAQDWRHHQSILRAAGCLGGRSQEPSTTTAQWGAGQLGGSQPQALDWHRPWGWTEAEGGRGPWTWQGRAGLWGAGEQHFCIIAWAEADSPGDSNGFLGSGQDGWSERWAFFHELIQSFCKPDWFGLCLSWV